MLTERIDLFSAAYVKVMQELPFDTLAVCILPDHLHVVWRLPANADIRDRAVKSAERAC